MLRARVHLEDDSRFSTHEMMNRIQELTKEELRGIPFAASIQRHVDSPVTCALFIKGHPDIENHPDGTENIGKGRGPGRCRSQLWAFREE